MRPIFDAGGGYLRGGSIELSTKIGQSIPNEQAAQLPRVRMEAARDNVLSHHPTAVERSLSSEYNCMGMVFAARRTWIDPALLGIILRGDSYRRVQEESELAVGDVVVYRNRNGSVSHVGVIFSIGLYGPDGTRKVVVLSQWGLDGEYFHEIDDVNPHLGEPADYWTDRK